MERGERMVEEHWRSSGKGGEDGGGTLTRTLEDTSGMFIPTGSAKSAASFLIIPTSFPSPISLVGLFIIVFTVVRLCSIPH